MSNKIKNIISIVLIITLLPIITGCDSKEQQLLNKRYVKQARKNAVEYIENKYGFTPDIISAEQERQPGMFNSTPLSTVLVKMKYEDKAFNVYIDGENENTNGKDNYQFNEIKDGMKKFADNVLHGIKNIKLESYCVSSGGTTIEVEDQKNMYNKYYDGSNIFEVIADNDSITLTFEYIETDLSSVADWSAFENIFKYDSFVKLRFISYRSENAMHSCEKYVDTDSKYAIYIDNYCNLSNNRISYESEYNYTQEYSIEKESYELGESNGFYYYVSGNDFDKVSFSEITPEDPIYWEGRGASNSEFVSPEFSVNTKEECVLIVYYPISEIDFHDEDEVGLAKSYVLNGEREYNANPLSVYKVGNYAVLTERIGGESKFNDFRFGFIESHKK